MAIPVTVKIDPDELARAIRVLNSGGTVAAVEALALVLAAIKAAS